MVCGIIWAGRVAPKGVEAAASYKKLTLIKTKDTYEKTQIENH